MLVGSTYSALKDKGRIGLAHLGGHLPANNVLRKGYRQDRYLGGLRMALLSCSISTCDVQCTAFLAGACTWELSRLTAQ